MRTGCGSHPLSAERVEELEESVWSVVRQENEREDQGEGVQNSGKTSTGVRSRDINQSINQSFIPSPTHIQ